MSQTFLGFGGNLGDPARSIVEAFRRLSIKGVAITRRSGLYRSPAWGPIAQPDFLNACAAAETDLSPRELLRVVQRVEHDLGRERLVRWGPRVIDIDILAYDDLLVDEPGLMLPHPRLFERAFVLVPLAEIAPEEVIAGRTVRDWASSVDTTEVRRLESAQGRGPRAPG